MICPTCYGHRLFYYQGRNVPCPECEGHGVLHCCDGLQAQPGEGIVQDEPASQVVLAPPLVRAGERAETTRVVITEG